VELWARAKRDYREIAALMVPKDARIKLAKIKLVKWELDGK
jgi:hypothetical protein